MARQNINGDEQVLDAGFLIDEVDRSAFERRVELLGGDSAGPIPPYDFTDRRA